MDANDFTIKANAMKFKFSYIIILSLCSLQCVSQNRFIPDSTINNTLILSNSESSKLFFKDIADVHLQEDISPYNPLGYSFSVFINKDSSQYLSAFEFDGDVKNAYSAFEIGDVSVDFFKEVRNFYSTDYIDFKTESGVSLGMQYNDFIELKGKDCYKKDEGIIVYYLDTDDS